MLQHVGHFRGDMRCVFGKVFLEHADQFLGGLIVRGFIVPCVTRVEHLARNVGAGGGNIKAEDRISCSSESFMSSPFSPIFL